MRKVTVVGAGMVGSTTAMRLAESGLADVALIDVDADLARGKALDISQALPLTGSPSRVVGGDDYRLAEGSEVVVVTAGFPRRPGMSRADLLGRNAEVVREVVGSAAAAAPESVIIMVTNPLDEMSYLAWKVTGWDRHRVMGMAGLLDGSRLAYFAARELGVSPSQVQPTVLGSHGEAMLPLPRFTTVAGVPLDELLPPEKLGELFERTREGGAEIVSLLRTASAYYAPSACVARMVEAVLRDEDYRVTASVLLEGEYGISGVFLGVPVVLGAGGWKRVVELPLEDQEIEGLEECARLIRSRMEELDGWLAGS
ncbi:malate dehydrogenase [Candidatus Solincola tengchongensis]|uniref:malate dehydrogenase n=1 Tax=Candidatus Solincola tengchongensis TaxID=2900693 RepID=UPI00257B2A05|nr:malate dehydrogenase [Candidatus Solincola tengchongensis]